MATQEKPKKLTDDDIKNLVDSEIKTAKEFSDIRAKTRTEAWDRYYGRKLGNEKPGRSKFITRDVMDTIEWMMPYFIRTFASGDAKIELNIEGQDSWLGKALMSQIQKDLAHTSPNQFTIFYQWFKDTLISDTAFVKQGWEYDERYVTVDFDGNLNPEQMQVLQQDPDVEIQNAGKAVIDWGQSISYSGVSAKVKQVIKDSLFVDNIPHWEFLTIKKARDVNDDHPKGHKTEVSLDYLKRIDRGMRGKDGKPYFKHLDELGQESYTDADTEAEKVSYMGDDAQSTATDHPKSEEGAKARIEFIEWYTRLDVNGDGYLEDIVCWVADDKLLRWEINDDELIGFSAIKAIIDPYKFYGISFGSLIIELQNLKTMLLRRILDMFDFQTSGRWRVSPGANVDIHTLLNFSAGKTVFAEQGAVEDLSPQPFQAHTIGILEYVDNLKENRTGVTRYNQGMQADSLNKTATGIVQIQTAAMQRLELIGRIFAETGLKDFYRKAAMLYQKNLKKPFIAKVHGQEFQVTREMIQGKVTAKVNMGVEATVGMQEAEKIVGMLDVLFKVNQLFPGLLGNKKIHNIITRYVTSMGFKDADDFINDLQEFTQTNEAHQKQQTEAQKHMMQVQEQLAQVKLQLEAMDRQLKEKEAERKAKLEAIKVSKDFQLEQQDLRLKERDSSRDYEIGLLSALASVASANQARQQMRAGRPTA